jgi:hypothetical protein
MKLPSATGEFRELAIYERVSTRARAVPAIDVGRQSLGSVPWRTCNLIALPVGTSWGAYIGEPQRLRAVTA